VWRAAGLLAAAGELGGTAALLAGARLPDQAAAFAAAVREAGLAGEPPSRLHCMSDKRGQHGCRLAVFRFTRRGGCCIAGFHPVGSKLLLASPLHDAEVATVCN